MAKKLCRIDSCRHVSEGRGRGPLMICAATYVIGFRGHNIWKTRETDTGSSVRQAGARITGAVPWLDATSRRRPASGANHCSCHLRHPGLPSCSRAALEPNKMATFGGIPTKSWPAACINRQTGATEWLAMLFGPHTSTDTPGTRFLVREVFGCGRHFEFSLLQ